ncbi:MAG TPA: acetamidase/formamidase family protein [Thermoleophilia bacterium]|nr:acetamidase/formamidase family protein [Thermoleophilia bacterium]
MIHVARDQSVFSLSAEALPVARIRPGDSVVLDTADCFSDQIQSADATPGGVDWEHINPATGPVFVEGAEPGDVLEVLIERIDVARHGVMAVSGDFGVLRDRFEGMSFALVSIEGDTAQVAGATVPVRPMIGVIGVAPSGAPVPCGSPGSHGGNMDTRLIGEGATLYLPVFAPGALLAAGDLHAAMGDGEICGTGVEVAGSVQLRVDVRRDIKLDNPALVTSDVVATIASAESLDEAADRAVSDMADLITQRLGLSASEATMLMSAAGELQVSQVVDPLKTARFAMPVVILAQFERSLF